MILRISYGLRRRNFDLAIVCCGYESRSRLMVERVKFKAAHKVALGYGSHEVLAFKENELAFAESGFDFYRVSDDDFREFVSRQLLAARREKKLRVLLDISCFTRLRLALLLQALMEHSEIDLEVFYSLAEYSPASNEEPRNEHLCPVSPFFAGWTGESEKAVALLSGLGYEQLRALGIMEHIDPYESWFFFPDSPISDYNDEVMRANGLLLRNVSASNILHYPVMDGPLLQQRMFSLIKALRNDYRCVLMPLGPKLMAFSAMIIGCVYRDVSVWRASAGRFGEPRDRKGSKHWARFALQFEGQNER